MIYRLAGRLVEKQPSFVVMDVNGVAYGASVSLATYAALPAVGEEARIYTHMSVREDGVYLFGFATLEEKQLFLLLITVSGIGSKLAVKILGGIGPEQLRQAIGSSDHAMLSTIPGVGKKTAERIVVELKDKFDGIVCFESGPAGDVRQDVIGALVNLGYKLPDCRKAVEGAPSDGGFEAVLKSALHILSGKG